MSLYRKIIADTIFFIAPSSMILCSLGHMAQFKCKQIEIKFSVFSFRKRNEKWDSRTQDSNKLIKIVLFFSFFLLFFILSYLCSNALLSKYLLCIWSQPYANIWWTQVLQQRTFQFLSMEHAILFECLIEKCDFQLSFCISVLFVSLA